MRSTLMELEIQDISLMDREQLIGMLLEFNNYSTFRFTRAWLKKQWTGRLRRLLLAAHRQHHGQDL